MEQERFKEILEIGETIRVEFKRCGNGIESDTYETVCSFLNRFGGDLFLGVTDSGRVVGVPENSVSSMIKNFISCVSNSDLITPTVYLEPRPLLYEGKTVIHIHVNPSAEVHSYKKEIFDRVINDGKGDEVVETLLGHLFFLYIKYNRDLSFISAGFLGEVGLSF